VGIQLTLVGGQRISAVDFLLTNGLHSYKGTYDLTDVGAASFVIASVATGSGYSLALSATSDDGGVTCAYPAPGRLPAADLTVENRTTTVVTAVMQCVNAQGLDSGALLAALVESSCPVWNTLVVNPMNVLAGGSPGTDAGGSPGGAAFLDGGTDVAAVLAAGQQAVVVGSATGPDPGAMAFAWTSTGGTLSSASGTVDPSSAAQPGGQSVTNSTVFTCPPSGAGTYSVTLTLSDGPLPDGGGCSPLLTTGTVRIACQ
jgi:hypothetical protein